MKRESLLKRCEICYKSEHCDETSKRCNCCLQTVDENKEHSFLANVDKACLPEHFFWQNENQQFIGSIVIATFSLVVGGLYLLPSSTDMIFMVNDLFMDNIFYSEDLSSKNFWIGVISSGFFFSVEQIIVKFFGLLIYSGFLGLVVGFFSYIRSFQHREKFYYS